MTSLTQEEAQEFAKRWLPAWTGNDPELLASFYSDDVFYLDPALPEGLTGKAQLLAYFRRLLARNPDWVWTQVEAIPLQGGFLNKWCAAIPVGDSVLRVIGVCTVQLDSAGHISRNEVYFDRSSLLAAIQKHRDQATPETQG